jgi:pimeloyl-ACP methyl ester carboxylesterase
MPSSAPVSIQLRLGRADDAAAIRALTRQAYAPWSRLIGREPLPMTADYDAALRQHRFDLAHRDGDLIGLSETRAEPDYLPVVNVAVAPAHQSAGLGRRLLAHAEALAREQGLATMRLYTNGAMARNISTYRRLGYRIDRQETNERGTVVHMVKTIDAQARRLLFLPGAGADPAFWRPLGDRLPAQWDKHYFGWPGLGDQPADPSVNSIDDLVAMVEAELWPGPVDLIAQSMGGVVALSVALRNPGRVRRLVLTATSGGVDVADLTRFDWRANYRREYPSAAAWITDARVDLTALIPTIACPMLLLWGEADPISPVAVGERLLGLAQDARLHVVAGGEHDLAQTRAEQIAPLIATHLG